MKKRMLKKVYFLHENWQIGGVERTNIQWLKILKENGFEVNLLNISNNETGVEYFHSKQNITSEKQLNLCLSRLEANDTLIICQPYLIKRILPIIFMLKRKKIKVVLTIRNSFDQFDSIFRKTLALLAVWIFSFFCHRLILNSMEQKKYFPFFFINKARVVVNPRFDSIDSVPSKKIFRDPPNEIVFIGRWSNQKGVKYFDSFYEVCRKLNIKFTAYCGKTEKPYQKVFLKDVMKYFSENNVALVFCSEFEGYPNILLEARSMGIPILFSPCKTGVTEIMDGYKYSLEFDKNLINTFENSLLKINKFKSTKRDIAFIEKHTLKSSNLIKSLGL